MWTSGKCDPRAGRPGTGRVPRKPCREQGTGSAGSRLSCRARETGVNPPSGIGHRPAAESAAAALLLRRAVVIPGIGSPSGPAGAEVPGAARGVVGVPRHLGAERVQLPQWRPGGAGGGVGCGIHLTTRPPSFLPAPLAHGERMQALLGPLLQGRSVGGGGTGPARHATHSHPLVPPGLRPLAVPPRCPPRCPQGMPRGASVLRALPAACPFSQRRTSLRSPQAVPTLSVPWQTTRVTGAEASCGE